MEKHTTPNEDIKWIRQKSKIDAIINCAIKIKPIIDSHKTFRDYLHSFEIPTTLNSEEDINKFWKSFNNLVLSLTEKGFPYYKNITSLLHFLSDIGYPCNKPDSVVLKVSKILQIIAPRIRTNKKGKRIEVYSDKLKIEAIHFIQKYCINRNMKPAVVDLYYLIYGGQKGARKYVTNDFSPLCNLD